MSKYLVTGGAGFIGSNLVDKLVDLQEEVIVIDNLTTGVRGNLNSKVSLIECDLASASIDDLVEYMRDVDVVFHLAAKARVQPSIDDPVSFNEANVGGTLNVLLAAHKAAVKRVVYSASSSCYGDTEIFPTPETAPTNPLSPYGLQKYIGEQYCKMFSEVYGLDTVSLRYFNIYGPGMTLEGPYCTIISIFGRQIQEGKPLTITNDGHQRRDFTYVGDVVYANILAATRDKDFEGDVFNIGNGENYSINEVADMFGGSREYGEKRFEPFETLADNTKAANELGWSPAGDLPAWIEKYKRSLAV